MKERILLLSILVPAGALADEVYLKGGGQLSGRIVQQTAAMVEVDIGAGQVTVPASTVLRIEKKRSVLDEYDERVSRIGRQDVAGWVALGDWASAQGLGAQAREAYNRALAVAPDDPRANAGLGRVRLDGRWVSEDEAFQAKGYVRYGGEWISPAEHAAIQRETETQARIERERQDAETRNREAEARAAEARAREAEAQETEGIPLWYGWGAGPVYWGSRPVVKPRPGVNPRPVPRGGR